MGTNKSKETQSNVKDILKQGIPHLKSSLIRTDSLYFSTSDNLDNLTFAELKFKHYLTFPNLYEGLKLWEGAVLLLRHILTTNNKLAYENKKIMDLGAGMGIIGITLAKMLNCKVTMTDYIPEVLDLCRENTSLNTYNENSIPVTEHLDWNDYENSPIVKQGIKFDIIIGCELVYTITHCDNLVKLIKLL
jgi:16S rRNA G1207 methylase RsmC